ncbi:RNA-directed DNA polymerase from mobile element jockey [Trichonephila clavipes]|nr:RNA-directed DNA polymerase from mobile element jockey [Trichonephila clavipes]
MRDFIDKHSPDLFLIQETHLRPEYSFNIPNYICYRNDRTGPTRGVEATLVALTHSDQEPFLVASIYAPPSPNYRNLGADLDGIFNIFKSAFLAGDYNAKHTSWGCNYSDPRGNYLLRYITNNNLDLIAPPTPTRYGTDSASTLDYALIKNLIWPCTADSIPELSSDPNPIDSQVSNLTDEILNAHASASRPFYHTEQPYVQGELKELFKERNKARKTWQHTRHPQHKTELYRLQNAIKRKIYHYRQQAWEDNLSTLNAEDNSLWGIAKAFRKKTSPISALNGPTGIALSDTNKTEVIAHSLEKQFHLNDIHNPRKDEIITSVVDAYMDSQTQRPSRKRKYPDSEQHGFRPRLSTSHQLLRVVEFIKEGNNKDECTAAVFLDIQKAFDRVWNTGLLFKLITYKIPPPLIYLLNSYISDRSFTVKINRTFSQLKKINAGVAQGSILAPTLFNLYVNDIIKHSNTIICMYADDTAILSRHRNLDTLVENINEHLAHLETWFSVWKIALNSSKTEAVFFSKRKPPLKLLYKIKEYPGLNTPSILV